MASADLAGFTITGTLINGDGIPAINPAFKYDNDANKNLFGHITRDLGSHARLGVMGYTGRQNGDYYGFPDQSNDISMWGVDGTFGAGMFQLNLQYVARTDTEAEFVPGEPTVDTNGGFAELLVRPGGSRWYGYGLYNFIEASAPVLNVKMFVPINVAEYESIAVGGGYLVYRNFRLYGEYGYDFNNELNRLTAGFTTAF
jgi:hypothetical protein